MYLWCTSILGLIVVLGSWHMKVFGDYIDSKIFFKKLRKFTNEEKLLVDNIFNSISHQDTNSKIVTTYNNEIFENSEFINEILIKRFLK